MLRLLIVHAGGILGRPHPISRSAFVGLLLWVDLFTTAAWKARAQITREISTFQQFYDLSNAELNNGKALRLKAFVLCYDSGWNQLYVHDGKLTGYFNPKLFRTQPQRGQLVEITGLATPVDGGRALTNLDLKILGPGTRPPAKRLTLPQLTSEYGQWIETGGRVRWPTPAWNAWLFRFTTGASPVALTSWVRS